MKRSCSFEKMHNTHHKQIDAIVGGGDRDQQTDEKPIRGDVFSGHSEEHHDRGDAKDPRDQSPHRAVVDGKGKGGEG